MRSVVKKSRGFTLLELIVVMTIIAIVAAIVVPSLGIFSISRATNNAASQLLEEARYAHVQAVAEGRTYRLNLDPSNGMYWLTADSGAGSFAAPTGDHGKQFRLPTGVQMDAQINIQPNILLNLTETQFQAQQQQQESPQLVDGQQIGQPGQLMTNPHDDASGQYIEFQSTGRNDPAKIVLTDRLGKKIEIISESPSELFHIPPAGAAQ